MNELEKAQLAVEQANQAVLAASETIQKLVAENAALKDQSEDVYAAGYNHGHLNTVDGIAYSPGTKDDFFGLALQVISEAEIPATDAAIAEIESEEAQNMYESILDNPNVYDMGSLVDSLESYAENKKAFAANLRAGRNG